MMGDRSSATDPREFGHATSAHYDEVTHRIVIELSTGVQVSILASRLQGLAEGSAAERAEIELSPSGLGLHWPRLDADLYVPGLIRGVFGTPRFMAEQSDGGRQNG